MSEEIPISEISTTGTGVEVSSDLQMGPLSETQGEPVAEAVALSIPDNTAQVPKTGSTNMAILPSPEDELQRYFNNSPERQRKFDEIIGRLSISTNSRELDKIKKDLRSLNREENKEYRRMLALSRAIDRRRCKVQRSKFDIFVDWLFCRKPEMVGNDNEPTAVGMADAMQDNYGFENNDEGLAAGSSVYTNGINQINPMVAYDAEKGAQPEVKE